MSWHQNCCRAARAAEVSARRFQRGRPVAFEVETVGGVRVGGQADELVGAVDHAGNVKLEVHRSVGGVDDLDVLPLAGEGADVKTPSGRSPSTGTMSSPTVVPVFVGEYAARTVTAKTTPNTFENALAEAAFLTGIERNADVVAMTSYAPLLNNVGSRLWPRCGENSGRVEWVALGEGPHAAVGENVRIVRVDGVSDPREVSKYAGP